MSFAKAFPCARLYPLWVAQADATAAQAKVAELTEANQKMTMDNVDLRGKVDALQERMKSLKVSDSPGREEEVCVWAGEGM